MLSDKIKTARTNAQLSQEELAYELHVTRQTISKWERNLSVPDADLLIKISEVCQVRVNDLLGQVIEENPQEIIQQLTKLNDQIAKKNRMIKLVYNFIFILIIAFLIFTIISFLIGFTANVEYGNVTEKIERID